MDHLRHDYQTDLPDENAVKASMFNKLRRSFSKAVLRRFYVVEDQIEDIWDLTSNYNLLADRLKDIAGKDPATWTAKNLVTMALICCILWNGIEDE
jgi:hypothetical protein